MTPANIPPARLAACGIAPSSPAPARPDYDRRALAAELERDEGLRLKAYRCTAGKRTIGIGRNLDDVGIRPDEQRRLGLTTAKCLSTGITRAEAFALLESDIDDCEASLDRKLPFWRRLSPVRQRVLLNMRFNLGEAGLLTFKNTLRNIEAGAFAKAAAGMRSSLWARQVGDRAERLARMMESGKC